LAEIEPWFDRSRRARRARSSVDILRHAAWMTVWGPPSPTHHGLCSLGVNLARCGAWRSSQQHPGRYL